MPHNICDVNENYNLPVVNYAKLVWLRNKLNYENSWLNAHSSILKADSKVFAFHLAEYNTLVSVVNAFGLPLTLDLDKDRYVIIL